MLDIELVGVFVLTKFFFKAHDLIKIFPLLVLAAFLFGCTQPVKEPLQVVKAELNTPFLLNLGQTASIEGTDFSINFESIAGNSIVAVVAYEKNLFVKKILLPKGSPDKFFDFYVVLNSLEADNEALKSAGKTGKALANLVVLTKDRHDLLYPLTPPIPPFPPDFNANQPDFNANCSTENTSDCYTQTDCVSIGGNWCNAGNFGYCSLDSCSSCSINSVWNCEDETSCTNIGATWCTSQNNGWCLNTACPVCSSSYVWLCEDKNSCIVSGGNWCLSNGDNGWCSSEVCPTCSSTSLFACVTQFQCENIGAFWRNGYCYPSSNIQCDAYSCSSHGQCNIINGQISCNCDSGYAGQTCSICANGFFWHNGFCIPLRVCGNGFCESGETIQSCSLDCRPASPFCGDNLCNNNENFSSCSIDCSFCGDNLRQLPNSQGINEACDGTDLADQTCISRGFTSGSLSCNQDCTFNTTLCTNSIQPSCGNSIIEGNEICDSNALNGQTCQSQGFVSGTLACNSNCLGFNTSACTNPVPAVCGNGMIESGEECDDGNTANGDACDSVCRNFNSPARINTLGWEDSPYVTPDGQQLFFMYSPWNIFPLFEGGTADDIIANGPLGPNRLGHHSNPNAFSDSDIYVSTRQEDGSWGVPVNLSFNDNTGDCCMYPNASGQKIYFNKNADIFVVEKNANGVWGVPVKIGEPISTTAKEDNPFINSNESRLYFTSDRPGGTGKGDLYYSDKQPDGSWSQPVNMNSLVPGINSSNKDDLIWLNENETVLYFGRTGDPSGFALFKSQFVNGQWTAPVGISFGNTLLVSEVSFADNGQTAYFAVIDFSKHDIIISYSTLQSNGQWSEPIPVD